MCLSETVVLYCHRKHDVVYSVYPDSVYNIARQPKFKRPISRAIGGRGDHDVARVGIGLQHPTTMFAFAHAAHAR